MNEYYEKIMQLHEAEELKETFKRWFTLSNNIKSHPVGAPIILPDMLWVAKSGVGKTNLLRLMSEYLCSLGNLMDFYGDVKFFEFYLSYCAPDSGFDELQRLNDEIDNAAGFRNEYKGIIHIDVSEWVEHYEERYFVSFMEYIAANSDNWLIVLTVNPDRQGKIHNFYAFLSMYLRLEKITLSLPKTEDLFEYIEKNFGAYGLVLEKDAKKLLYDTVEKLRKNRYFDGFKTVKLLCQDIAYKVFSDEKRHTSLTAENLREFSYDSEYVKRTVSNIERVNKIGLVNGEK